MPVNTVQGQEKTVSTLPTQRIVSNAQKVSVKVTKDKPPVSNVAPASLLMFPVLLHVSRALSTPFTEKKEEIRRALIAQRVGPH